MRPKHRSQMLSCIQKLYEVMINFLAETKAVHIAIAGMLGRTEDWVTE